MTKKPYRVAQWATGNVGLRSLKAIIEHPHLELAAVCVYPPGKVGRDTGALCDLPRTGVIATDKIEDIVAAKPDCVAYMPIIQRSMLSAVCSKPASMSR